MSLIEQSVETQLTRLGFVNSDFGMATCIGRVKIDAVEHPFKGIAFGFTYVGARTASQFESFFPKTFGAEEIVNFIVANFKLNFRDSAEECKRHFVALGIPVKAS